MTTTTEDTMAYAPAFAPASPKQVSFLRSLLDSRDLVMAGVNAEDVRNLITRDVLDRKVASNLIDRLVGAPKARVAAPKADLVEGMYQTANGDIFRVRRSRESGRLYAMKLDLLAEGAEFTFARGAIYRLTLADRMPLEVAKAWGVQTGICCMCGAFLTDPKSVAAGIGPICAKGFGY
jgi:hypothetical protein